jgi:riboflavin kinase / FMN adenylyltransferase
MIPVLTDLNELPHWLQEGCAAVGNFDGVHRGHVRLVDALVQMARAVGGPAVVLTFDPPPIVLLKPDVPLLPPITSLQRRAELLGQLGIQALIALPTTHELLNLSPQQFFDDVIVGQLATRGMVEGPNFYFGKDRQGDTQLLAQLCAKNQIALTIVEAQSDETGMISSSRIRQLLACGEVEAANKMLTRPFRISGMVSQGAGRGKRLLVPTANLIQIQSLVPEHGVYGGLVEINGRPYRAAVNIGPNPTFSDLSPKVEIHLLQWQGELYGQTLHCDLIAKIRSIKKFETVEALLNQIEADIQQIVQRVALPQPEHSR